MATLRVSVLGAAASVPVEVAMNRGRFGILSTLAALLLACQPFVSAHLDSRDWSGKSPTSFVLTGIRAGETTVTVRSGNWTKSYEVTVESVVAKRSP